MLYQLRAAGRAGQLGFQPRQSDPQIGLQIARASRLPCRHNSVVESLRGRNRVCGLI